MSRRRKRKAVSPVGAANTRIRIGQNVSHTLFKSSSLPGTTEAVIDCVLPESEEGPLQAAALVDRAHDPNDAGAPLKITGEQTIRTADEQHKTFAEYLDRG